MMMILAGKKIEVEPLYSFLEEYCEGYLVSGCKEADLVVKISQADIDFEREKSAAEDALQGIPVRKFSDAYLETLAVYRKIAEWMPTQDTMLFHGSVVAVDGNGYLFAAKSGTGKSTHTRLWRELFKERAQMINDDKPLLNISEDKVVAFGTPWNGKHRLGTNASAPLKGLCVLRRGKENKIRRADSREIYPVLLQQTYRPANAIAMAQTLRLLDLLEKTVPVYVLECNMELEAARVAYEKMCE